MVQAVQCLPEVPVVQYLPWDLLVQMVLVAQNCLLHRCHQLALAGLEVLEVPKVLADQQVHLVQLVLDLLSGQQCLVGPQVLKQIKSYKTFIEPHF